MLLDIKDLNGTEYFTVKFIRTGNEIYITNPDKDSISHLELAEKDKILDWINRLKSDKKDEVDAGMFFISGKTIQMGSASDQLSIPETDRARKVTLRKLKLQLPDYSIIELS